ncbi:MAG: hypothetical protein OXF52_06335 [Candidatus Dadabacteria bacterium]|nr:hypothetical protein [Candidatus Dadabacteria bacterium]
MNKFKDIIINGFRTFNIYPQSGPLYHLKKANIAKSDFEALSSDWDNVSRDLSVAFSREIGKMEEIRKIEG